MLDSNPEASLDRAVGGSGVLPSSGGREGKGADVLSEDGVTVVVVTVGVLSEDGVTVVVVTVDGIVSVDGIGVVVAVEIGVVVVVGGLKSCDVHCPSFR